MEAASTAVAEEAHVALQRAQPKWGMRDDDHASGRSPRLSRVRADRADAPNTTNQRWEWPHRYPRALRPATTMVDHMGRLDPLLLSQGRAKTPNVLRLAESKLLKPMRF